MSYEQVLQDIAKFSKAPNVKVIAISKLQPTNKVRSLIAQGHRVFGENYVQEALEKMGELHDQRLEWHFVGHLQKNKAKHVVGAFELIHSVDSFELAEKISEIAQSKGIVQKALLEINLADEPTKSGFSAGDLFDVLPKMNKLQNFDIVGLMTMPPLFENPEEARPFFRKLKELSDQMGFKELSMGTSSDYKVALEEGATLVRLGTILFGERVR